MGIIMLRSHPMTTLTTLVLEVIMMLMKRGIATVMVYPTARWLVVMTSNVSENGSTLVALVSISPQVGTGYVKNVQPDAGKQVQKEEARKKCLAEQLIFVFFCFNLSCWMKSLRSIKTAMTDRSSSVPPRHSRQSSYSIADDSQEDVRRSRTPSKQTHRQPSKSTLRRSTTEQPDEETSSEEYRQPNDEPDQPDDEVPSHELTLKDRQNVSH